MRRKKMLTGVLTAALLVGCISPLGVTGTEVPEEVRAEQLVMFDETEMQKEDEEAVTAEEDVKNAEADANELQDETKEQVTGEEYTKSAEADANGFVIEDGVLTGYSGSGGDVTIPDGVTSIGRYAFEYCSSLTSITIPASVTSIGEGAFGYCTGLTAINVSEGNKNYTSENGILYNVDKDTLIQCPEGKTGEIIILDSVTSIGYEAFRYCSSLTSITIPASVTSIGGRAFEYCSSLTSITIPSSVTVIGGRAFFYCSSLTGITISDGVTVIGGNAFTGCSSLTNITIPASVTSIGGGDELAFAACSSLTAINVLEGNKNYTSEDGILYNVDKDILIQCPQGKTGEIIIPANVTSIEPAAFGGCSRLTNITIPASVISISSEVFYGCDSLTSINVSEGNKYYTSEDGILYNVDKDILIQCPEGKTGEIIFPDSVTSIGYEAFKYCSNLTSITIPGSVTSIEPAAFKYCSNLTSITIPNSVTSIGYEAFRECNEDLTIYCIKGSYAEEYAIENNINYSYVVGKDTQTITANDTITKIFGDSAFSIDAATDGDGVLSYVSDNEAVATVDSAGTITLTGAGTAHITITASETATYKAAEKVITITVEKKAQTITASDITKTFGEAAFPLNAAVDGDGTLTYVSDNTSVATVDANGIVTLVNAGTIHIAIKASETANYKAAEKIITVTVNPSETPSGNPETNEQTITAKNITKTYGDKAFSLGAKTNGGGKLTYKISNTKIATIDKKGKVTIKGCGRTQIKITAAANGNYQEATKTITLTVKPKKVAVTSVKSTKSKALTVKWKQDKKAKGYIVEYSTDKKFKKNVKTVTISKNSTVSKTVTKLKGGKKYYVRVCAYTTADGKKIKGSYSKVMNVVVKK